MQALPPGHRCKPRIGRVEVACQTDALVAGTNNNNSSTPTVSQTKCNNLGISGTGKTNEQAVEQPNVNKKNGQVAHKEHNIAAISTASVANCDETGEGTLILCITGFSKMSDTICSPNQRIRGVPWRIMVMPKQHMVQKKSQKCMGFFLQCCPDRTYSDAWSCKADAEMRLLAVKSGATNFVRKTSHVYTAKENDWGYSCFMTWADVLDESQGYIQNDHVTLEITVKAEWPKNMMTRADFCKSIDQWYNLAEMQMSRGLVDLSIEANAQALKFCKDKDIEMKEKLEKQKERLVKKKVLDSINRIENKSEAPKPVEPLKPTSLRQALTGAQKTIAAKGGSKSSGKKDKRTMQQLKKKKAEMIKDKEMKKRNESTEWHGDVTSVNSASSEDNGKSPISSSPPVSPKDKAAKAEELPTKFGRKRPSDDCSSTTGCVGEDCSSDLSDDYQEDDSIQGMCEQCASGQCDSVSSSEEPAVSVSMTEHGCQTEDNIDVDGNPIIFSPLPIPRRERRHAGSGTPQFIEKKIYATPDDRSESFERQRLTRFYTDVFAVDNLDLVKDLELALSEVDTASTPAIASLSTSIYNRLDNLSDDHGSCCLAAGLCTVHSRRILQASIEFCKTVAFLYTDDVVEQLIAMFDRPTERVSPKQISSPPPPVNIHGRKFATAVRRNPGSGTSDVTRGTDTGSEVDASKKEVDEAKLSSAAAEIASLFRKHRREVVFDLDEEECERSIRTLLSDVGGYNVDDLILEKIHHMKFAESESALLPLLHQLFEYSQALAASGDRMEEMLDAAKKMQKYHQSTNGIRAAEAMRKSQEKVAELDAGIQKKDTELKEKDECIKKLEEQLQKSEVEKKAEREKTEQVQVQLKEVRGQLKKMEKKSKSDETRIASLQAEKIETDDKIKAFKKEIESIKKKTVDERAKAKKEKERDAELIRRNEADALEKENERERERASYEEKILVAKNKEIKWEKERKALTVSLNAMTERVRASEISQIELMFSYGSTTLNRAKDDCHAGLFEAEENLKRARTHADMETMKKSMQEWRSASDEVDKLLVSLKTDYESTLEQVTKGTKNLSQCEFKIPSLPTLPKTVRVPPVQIVQPSLIPSPSIAPPPAGVIGQPRTPQLPGNRFSPSVHLRDVHSPTTSASNVMFNNPSPPSQRKGAGSAMRVEEGNPVPATSPWSWSTPLGNLSDMIRPVVDHQNHSHNNHELWPGSETPNTAQIHRPMFAPPAGWTNASPQTNWRQNPSRSPGMPFYDS
ncbi:unnamed protein product [Auanema sp. JU1783]|nr:unnamed protein product [Auanema sp. JU1783]